MSAIAPPAASFYITGGTLPPDALSYVERQADRDLLAALRQGEYCYLLNSRQMGKSSLCVRAIARLREEGTRTVFLDLTKFGGRNLTAEQWYAALLAEVGRELGLRAQCLTYWKEHPELPAVQRLFGAITEVALKGSDEWKVMSDEESSPTRHSSLVTRHSRLVIFIDEIDVTRSLPFSTDEFFAAIRQCYVGRATEPALKGVTVCLLGTATPAELIEDTRISPFNIGRRIEVRDFTPEEAAPLALGLTHDGAGGRQWGSQAPGETRKDPEAGARTLLKRILSWTGRHPYLTQRLCRAVAEQVSTPTPDTPHPTPADVDRLCKGLFLTHTAKEGDDNLALVRNRLLKSEVELASLLELYGKLRAGQAVRDDETNPVCGVLKLSGVAKVESGRLVVRNRIYGAVFDRAWVIQHMPDAELRRQRAAFQRGLLRATMVASAIVAVMAGLVLTAVRQTRRADRQARRADRIARQEAQTRQLAEGRLYAADMNLAQQFWDAGNAERAQELLDAHRPRAGEPDLRGFEWRYLWRRFHAHVPVRTLRGSTGAANGVSFSPDGRTLASCSGDRTVKLWDVTSERGLATLKGFKADVVRVAFSPDGKLLATGGGDGLAELWNVASRRQVALLRGHKGEITGVQFSANGRILATSSVDGTVKLWNVRTGQQLATLRGHTGAIWDLTLSPNGRTLATASLDNAQLWDVATGRALAAFSHPADVLALAFSPDAGPSRPGAAGS